MLTRSLLVLVALLAAWPMAAQASNLYINLSRLRVEDKKLAAGCELVQRSSLNGDKVMCTDVDGRSVYSWHKILLSTMYGAMAHTCELNVIKENHKAFQFRWHATMTAGSARCKMHWANDNTLDVEPGIL